jgi:STE24 endopeptidase
MYNLLFYIIVAIIMLDFLFDNWLNYLNLKTASSNPPDEVSNVYIADRYRKSQEYKRTNIQFSFLTSTFSLVILMIMLFLHGFAFVNDMAYSITQHYILVALFFFGILMVGSDILGMPFSIYETFIIEEKYGFNKTTAKTFIFDKIKSWIMGAFLGGIILALIIWFYMKTGKNFWIWAWMFVSVFQVFMMMFYSNIIVPLFNKQTALEEGELRSKIEEFASSVGFKLTNIFVIDGSKRSTKANAYFAGLGSKKRIVLYDTLINDLENEEIVAVLAHEIGHYKKKHSLSSTILSIIQTGLTLFLFSLFVGSSQLSIALGVPVPNFHISIIAFGILYSPISNLSGFLFNILSRKNEYEADKFAAENYESEKLISALKKLSVNNLSNLTPHPLYVKIHYSHPPLLSRIRALRVK